MTRIEQLRGDLTYVVDVLHALQDRVNTDDGEDLTEDEWRSVNEGADFVRTTTAEIQRMERLEAAAATTVARGGGETGDYRPPPDVNLNRNEDPYDLASLSFTAGRDELRSRAVTAIERTRALPDANRAAAVDLLERIDTPSGALARHMLATGNEAYRSGWQKLISGNGALITDTERQALDMSRALSLVDSSGGFAVPFTLDPTIISTRAMSTNPFRRIGSVKTTVTDSWNGVTSAGMTVSWDGEGAEVSDDSPTVGQPSIRVHKAQGFAVGSIEITQDWASIESDLRTMIQDGKDDAEGIAFTIGGGDVANQPTGIITALAGTSSEVPPTAAETFADDDVYKLEEALPARYRLAFMDGNVQQSRASWIAARSTYNRVRQFDTQGGASLWVTLGMGLPQQLLGYQDYEASAMDGADGILTTETAQNRILALGDFRYYTIVDRVGLAVEFVPHLFGSNRRPTGQRGWYCFWRVGADSVNDDAFRLLNVATAA